ncbi:MAG: YegS/Rv2252/BmrU family lipid kinase [Bacteroidales bacterium]|jgi:YegS/Rv2252/BmrU family lipid kinase
MNISDKWIFIINPVAGGGFAAGLEGKILEMAKRFNITAETVFSEKRGHASFLSEKYAAEGYTHIIGVGGDGTFNEVAAPLINRKKVITGLVSAGTGNDFIQILGFPDRFDDSHWEQLFRCEVIPMDAGSCNGMIFLNGMGLGFDAQVASENYSAPGEVKKGGKNKYIWHILKTILFYREKTMTVLNNGERTQTDCFINTVAVGRRFAGGFFLTPKAIANDGLLDVCSVKRLTIPQRLSILMMVPKGTHINDKKVNYYQTDKLSLEFGEKVPYHLDGELYFSEKFDISVMKQSLNVIYNPHGDHYFDLP